MDESILQRRRKRWYESQMKNYYLKLSADTAQALFTDEAAERFIQELRELVEEHQQQELALAS